ncbi:ABC transporter substrate-binding protein [Luoshenia tenuis]|jgi:NitT/TauT family transport system substrate-binding protein|uniref:ABC transporter substrate-binding protein n=1 Tax=Luoshenia tenuis TaxID=2763654 RepID=UPI003D93A719
MNKTLHNLLRPILALTLCACMLLGFTGCGAGDELRTVTVCEVTHSVFYAPQYVAMNKGFFEEEGLKVELTNGGGTDKVMTAVLAGQAQIGLMGPEGAVYVYNEGKTEHVRMFAQVTKRDGSFLVAREAPEGEFSWDDLRGKVLIGGRKGGVPEMTLEYVLRKQGLTPGEDVEVLTNVQFDLMAGAFSGGNGDYVALFEPVASQTEQQNVGTIVAAIGEASGEVPYTGYVAQTEMMKKEPELFGAYTRAIYKAQQWVQNATPREIAEAIAPSFPDSDVALLTTVAENYQKIDAWMATPQMKEEAFGRLQDIMDEAGELKARVPFEGLVDNSFADAAVEKVK